MGKLLLLGYFGAGNLGDDGFVVDFLKRWQGELRAHGQSCDYTAAGSRHPLDGFVEADEVGDLLGTAISRKALLTVRPSNYDALVAPGGSLLQNATSMRSLLFYLHVISRFTNAGVPVYMLGQGFGPFKGKVAGPLAARTLKQVKLLTLRDKASYAWSQRSRLDCLYSCDSLLGGRLSTPTDIEGSFATFIPKAHRNSGSNPEQQATSLTHLICDAQALGPRIVVAILHRIQDRSLFDQILSIQKELFKEGHAGQTDPTTWVKRGQSGGLSTIARAAYVISYRLHGLILAAAYGVPGLGVAYDPKVSAFCDEMGFPYCTPQDVLDGKAIELVRDLWHNREQVKATMLERRAVALQRLEAAEARFAQLMWGAL